MSKATAVHDGFGRWAWATAAVSLGLWLFAWFYIVTAPEAVLVGNVLVDDALYFAVPARNFVAGHGFAFDGVEPTNGVQALWALVCVGLAAAIDDPLLMLRAMVGTSGVCWLLAAAGLLFWLRRYSVAAAVLAATGFAFAGVHQRLAFQGMENGLHALVGVSVLWAGNHAVGTGWTRKSAFILGAALALFGVSRTEGVLLGPLIGVPLLLGWLGGPVRNRERVSVAIWLALPFIVLVGGSWLFSKVVFGTFLPVSGSVKQFYESSWGGYADPGLGDQGKAGLINNISWHLKSVARLALAPWRVDGPSIAASCTGLNYRVFRTAVWVVVGTAVVVAFVRCRQGVGNRGAGGRIAACFGVYALVHLIVIGLSLPHFTSYATWYFASEVTALWVLVGLLFSYWRGRERIVVATMTILTAAAGLTIRGGVEDDVRLTRFRAAGQWLNANTEPNATIGALSSGLVGWYAADRRVINLDGLINTRSYLDDYLSRGRLADYFAIRGIGWFADYAPIASWRHGVRWCGHVPASRLVPRRYWRMPGGEAYAIWQVLPADSGFALLGDDGPEVRDRYAELAVAADVHERFPIVAHSELAATLAGDGTLRVARSIADGAGELLHVLVRDSELDNLAFNRATVFPEHLVSPDSIASGVVLGYDLDSVHRAQRTRLAVTLFWLQPPAAAGIVPLLAVYDAGGKELASTAVGHAYGSLPLVTWSKDQVVPETVTLEFEASADYEYELRLGDVRLVRQ